MRIIRAVAIAATTAALAFSVSACGGAAAASGGPTDGVTSDEAVTEYREEAKTLSALAPGWKWPSDVGFPSKMDDGVETRYQRGFGAKEADYYWYCSWSSRAVSATATEADRKKAVDQIMRVRDTRFYNDSLQDSSRAVFERILKQASLGDMGPLSEDFAANCPQTSAR